MNLGVAGFSESCWNMGEYLPTGISDKTKTLHFLPAMTLSVTAVLIAVASIPTANPIRLFPPFILVSTLIFPSLVYKISPVFVDLRMYSILTFKSQEAIFLSQFLMMVNIAASAPSMFLKGDKSPSINISAS